MQYLILVMHCIINLAWPFSRGTLSLLGNHILQFLCAESNCVLIGGDCLPACMPRGHAWEDNEVVDA